MFHFYRKLNDFVKRFYLNLPVVETSEGKSQFRIVYDTTGKDVKNLEKVMKDVEQSFNFEVPQIRNCLTCAYNIKTCSMEKTPEDGENCQDWYESE